MPNIDLKDHPQIFQDRPQQIWVLIPRKGDLPVRAHSTPEAAKHDYKSERITGLYHSPEETTLHRPSLQPIYGGPTLLEALWAEMDRLMEALMTGETADDACTEKGYHGVPAPYDDFDAPCEHWDNGDRYRAQELAWVLAIVTNAYNPSVDAIRAEAVRRWNEAQDKEKE